MHHVGIWVMAQKLAAFYVVIFLRQQVGKSWNNHFSVLHSRGYSSLTT